MNNEFKWTDQLVAECHEFIKEGAPVAWVERGTLDKIELFKQSKIPKNDWEVTHYSVQLYGGWHVVDAPIDLEDIRAKIHSVKRLSDGEVFSVGDTVTSMGMERHVKGSNFTIVSFKINEYGRMLAETKYFSTVLGSLIKVKRTPLFTTEDGKEIFSGDEVFILNTDNGSVGHSHMPPCKPYGGVRGQFKYFSTREAAEAYTKLNTPKYSLQDFKNAYSAPLDSPLWNETVERLMTIEKYRV